MAALLAQARLAESLLPKVAVETAEELRLLRARCLIRAADLAAEAGRCAEVAAHLQAMEKTGLLLPEHHLSAARMLRGCHQPAAARQHLLALLQASPPPTVAASARRWLQELDATPPPPAGMSPSSSRPPILVAPDAPPRTPGAAPAVVVSPPATDLGAPPLARSLTRAGLGLLGVGAAVGLSGAVLWALDGRDGCLKEPGQELCPYSLRTGDAGLGLVISGGAVVLAGITLAIVGRVRAGEGGRRRAAQMTPVGRSSLAFGQ